MRELLLGYLLETLEPEERAEVEMRLCQDPALKRELEELRRQLEPLSGDLEEFEPPPGLADRTCEFVAANDSLPAREAPARAASDWHVRDFLVAASILLCALSLLLPALLHTRFQAEVNGCQNNLRQIGLALAHYSEFNSGYFPHLSPDDEFPGAGIYAPTLLETGFLDESRVLVCPTSRLAREDHFSIPTLHEIRTAKGLDLNKLRRRMGGSYGYSLGFVENGRYQPPRNFGRPFFAVLSDSPSLYLEKLQSDNHGGYGQNVLFEAGNVQFWKSPRPDQALDNIFTNAVGYVAPGTNPRDSVIGNSAAQPSLTLTRE